MEVVRNLIRTLLWLRRRWRSGSMGDSPGTGGLRGLGMFGEIVRAHRRRLGLTQEELAEKTGISARSISKIETDRALVPRMGTVRLLADAFGLCGPERDRFNAASVSESAMVSQSATRAAGRAGATAGRRGGFRRPRRSA